MKKFKQLLILSLILTLTYSIQAQVCGAPDFGDDFNDLFMDPAYQSNSLMGTTQWQEQNNIAGATVDGSGLMGIQSNGDPSVTELMLPTMTLNPNESGVISFDFVCNSFEPIGEGIVRVVIFGPVPEEIEQIPIPNTPMNTTGHIDIEIQELQLQGVSPIIMVWEDPTGNSGFFAFDNLAYDTSCDDNDPCTIDDCDPITGECIHIPIFADALLSASAPTPCHSNYIGYIVTQNGFVVDQTIPLEIIVTDPQYKSIVD